MCIERYNSEGYVDTTAQTALSRIEKEERRQAWPVVYVCSAYRGNERVNVMRARQYCKFVVSRKHIPLAPHLLLPQFLTEITQRGLALKMDVALLARCDELWTFGEATEGMTVEIEAAQDMNKPVRRFRMEEVLER